MRLKPTKKKTSWLNSENRFRIRFEIFKHAIREQTWVLTVWRRLNTIYCAATPEYGNEKFKEKFSREIERVKGKLPDALYVGVADGEKDNWIFLKKYTQRQILDFYHDREYISKAASAIFGPD